MSIAQSADVFTDHTHGTPIPGTPAPVPCPFCGTVELVAIEDCSCEDTPSFHVNCDQCGAEGPIADSALEAATAWNARRSRPGLS